MSEWTEAFTNAVSHDLRNPLNAATTRLALVERIVDVHGREVRVTECSRGSVRFEGTTVTLADAWPGGARLSR